MLIVWITFGLIGIAAVALFLSAVKQHRNMVNQWTHRPGQEYPWLHPPDDDDGVSILEEVDQDGQDTR